MKNRKMLRIAIPILSIVFIIVGTYVAIKIGQGYRPTLEGLAGTGLLAANSFPPGAEVYLNDKLTTATDDTINLPPGEYDITIRKDGYTDWKKKLNIKQELVSQTNATLFRSVPSLSPLTLSGAANIIPSPDGQKIAYAVASASATTKNGLYVLPLTSSPLSLQNGTQQIARNTPTYDFSEATILWSPNSSQLLVHFDLEGGQSSNFLLNPSSLNNIDTLPDVTARLSIIFSEWEEDVVLRETKQFALLPDEFKLIATASAVNLYFSPNEERVMYTATDTVKIPENLIPTPPATSTQTEYRDLEAGGVYIYDLTEDKNFKIGQVDPKTITRQKNLLLLSLYQQLTPGNETLVSSQNGELITRFNHLQDPQDINKTIQNFQDHYSSIYVNQYQWYPDSNHILIDNQDRADIIEYDATNLTTLYAGPFLEGFVYPWPDGSKLILLTNLNPSSTLPANLYAVDIR